MKQFQKPYRSCLPYDIDDLSVREREALKLLANGLDYQEIATIMGISINGVRAHIKEIYRKLKVNSNVQAAKKYWVYFFNQT